MNTTMPTNNAEGAKRKKHTVQWCVHCLYSVRRRHSVVSIILYVNNNKNILFRTIVVKNKISIFLEIKYKISVIKNVIKQIY